MARTIPARMEALDLTLVSRADRLGKAGTEAIRKWRDGKAVPSSHELADLARALECTADYLLGLCDDPTPKPSADAAYSERLARIIRSFPRRGRGSAREHEWQPIPEEDAKLVQDGTPLMTRLCQLADSWNSREITTSTSREIARNQTLFELVEEETGMTLGELRWLWCNVIVADVKASERVSVLREDLMGLRGLVGSPGAARRS